MPIKQDINMPRTPTDVERRYKLAKIKPLEEDVEVLKDETIIDSFLSTTSTHSVENRVITNALAGKVSKETGKDLSSNDFTDYYIERINNSFGSSHSHNNKAVIDGITSQDINNWNSKSNASNEVVYDNSTGQVGNISFDKSIGNADYIDIVFGNNSSIYDTKRIYNPVGKKISLTLGSCSANSFANRTQTYAVNANGMVAESCHKFALNSTGAITVTNNAQIVDSDKLIVYKVIAYKN